MGQVTARTVRVSAAAFLVASVATATTSAQEASFQGLGALPNDVGFFDSKAHGISDDGAFIVGESYDEGWVGFIWHEDTGMTLLPDIPGASIHARAFACADGGSIVVGYGNRDGGNINDAIRWVSGAPVSLGLPLGPNPNDDGEANAVSPDGLVIVGQYGVGGGLDLPYRWVNGTVTCLGSLRTDGLVHGVAEGLTPDGLIIVGSARNDDGFNQAFRWEDGVMSALPSGGSPSVAHDVSDDGSIVVGWATTGIARWTNGAYENLGYSGRGRAVSGNGAVMVGNLWTGTQAAMIWDASNGVRDLQEVLETEHGLVLTGWTLFDAWDISADGTVIVGYGFNPDGNYEAWRAVVPRVIDTDTDGDGLLDDWEVNGIPYLDGGGVQQRYLLDLNDDQVSDADPMHKDLFVEVDSMFATVVNPAAMTLVKQAFAASPVTNPDGMTGVTLHIEIDDGALPFQQVWPVTGWFPTGFDAMKVNYFGTALERVNPNAVPLLEAKQKAFRYSIYCFKTTSGVLGTARGYHANDFVVAYGQLNDLTIPAADSLVEASTFMHELGHCLNLRHGGGDHTNRKPNYLSVMNYTHSKPYRWLGASFRLDYSRGTLLPLDESNLDETLGFTDTSGYNTGRKAAYHAVDCDIMAPCANLVVETTPYRSRIINAGGIDLNGDGSIEVGVCADLNYQGSTATNDNAPSPCQVQHDYNDWANLVYALAPVVPLARQGGETLEELSGDLIQEINDSLPAICTGDLDESGGVGIEDFLGVLSGWGTMNGDVTFDGNTGIDDFLLVLGNWGACP